jgi:hypothetical protein
VALEAAAALAVCLGGREEAFSSLEEGRESLTSGRAIRPPLTDIASIGLGILMFL